MTIPTCTSDGRAMTPADDVGAEQQDRRQHHRVRQDPAVVGPGERPGDVGDGEADEDEGPGRGGGGAGTAARRERADARGGGDLLAEGAGDVVPEGEDVEPGAGDQCEQRPMTMNGATCAATSAARPASEPTTQNRNWSSVSASSSRTAVVNEPRRAVMAAPARASLTGVAPPRPSEPMA